MASAAEDVSGSARGRADAFRLELRAWALVSLGSSPLARKIIAFNLLGIVVLVAAVLWSGPFRHSLVLQRESGLVAEAALIADVFEADGDWAGSGAAAQELLAKLRLPGAVEVFVFDRTGRLLATTEGLPRSPAGSPPGGQRSTPFMDALNRAWETLSAAMTPREAPEPSLTPSQQARAMVAPTLRGAGGVETRVDAHGNTIFSVASPIRVDGRVLAVAAVTSAAGEIDRLARSDREKVLQLFAVATLVSLGLSLLTASAIVTPISALAGAAEAGADRDRRRGRIAIPDLTARSDEIGRLSGALRAMVAALYDRIEANEQFAADVAHEIKNPLASLCSAVGTMRVARREDQRETLLDVIDHDVRRLDRLVSDISSASRLDSELVRDEQSSFDLLKMLAELCEHMRTDAETRAIDLSTDLPAGTIVVRGLQPRLAQVFVNLMANAMSFCDEGDGIRVWARRRDGRVLVGVEDTGPGIPGEALEKIFERFYSERPERQFGNNSGLGLAISRQIVEAHGGFIRAENVRPTADDLRSEPAGARFVVGLPV